MSDNEKKALSPEQLATAMESPKHLANFLLASDRRFVVMDAVELTEALPWPDGVEAFMQVVACYRDHRRTIPNGFIAPVPGPKLHHMLPQNLPNTIDVPVMKEELLEPEEIDEAIAQLLRLKEKALLDRAERKMRPQG